MPMTDTERYAVIEECARVLDRCAEPSRHSPNFAAIRAIRWLRILGLPKQNGGKPWTLDAVCRALSEDRRESEDVR